MSDTPLMQEARELIAFYDEHGLNWESALGFAMLRGFGGERIFSYIPATHFLMPRSRWKERSHDDRPEGH